MSDIVIEWTNDHEAIDDIEEREKEILTEIEYLLPYIKDTLNWMHEILKKINHRISVQIYLDSYIPSWFDILWLTIHYIEENTSQILLETIYDFQIYELGIIHIK